jgi:capsular polysaccharide transport system permease protein
LKVSSTVLARLKGNALFLTIVAAPTLLAAVYFGLIASDVYVSESRFVVRTTERQMPTGLGVLLQGAGISRSLDDTYSVHEYILSRDALQTLQGQLDVRKIYAREHIDVFSRFPGLISDNSFEDFLEYYRRRVDVHLDSSSPISTLIVRAYTAEDARQLNDSLLVMSENLINKVNERARKDLIQFAAQEVAAAEERAREATLAVSAYRNRKAVVDPERQSGLQLQQVSKLQDELIGTRAQISQVSSISRSSTQIPALEARARSLEAAIAAEMAKITGGRDSLTSKAPDYDRYAIERAFAEKQLGAALASLEQARNEAQRKQLYLERIVQPNKPDVPIEPRRLRSVATAFILSLVAWGIMTILIAGVREHRE